MPSALLHQQIALLELDQRLRDAERRHRLFRRSDTDDRTPARAARTTAPATPAAARVIDLPAALTSPASPELAHPASPAKVA